MLRLTFLLLCALIAVAQTNSTTVLGTTTDASAAAVPGVEITVTNVGTNQSRSVTSNDLGYYSIPGLDSGTYRVTARKTGFRTQVQNNINLTVNQRLTIDFALAVGEVVESVEVTGAVAALDTASASLGTVVDHRKIVDLPLNGRNYAQLAWLVPGVTPGQRHSNDSVNFSNPFQISANGQRQFNTEVTMDGLSINNALLNQSNLRPSIDGIEEFRVQTGNYSAEFGFQSGAQVNLVMKAGTNSVHGTAFEFLRNDKLDARDFFAAPGAKRPPFKQNQFGVTAGGPVVKNKTFVFGSYEGYRRRRNVTGSSVVLTPAQRGGDFSAATAPVRDPDNPGQFFPNNIIPTNRLAPQAQKLLAYMPLPNAAGAVNYIGATIAQANQDQGFLRVDHNFSERDRIFFRYGISQQHVPEFQLNPNFSIVQDIRDQNAVLSHSHLFGAATLSELRVGYNRANDVFLGPDRSNFSPLRDLGIAGVAEDARLKGIPSITIPGFLGINEHFLVPLTQVDWTYTISENVTHNVGRHSFKAGLDLRKARMNRFFQQSNRGGFNFTGVVSGNAVADFMLGLPADTSRAIGPGIFNAIRQVKQGYYFQDDWRITPKLTLNLGLRYEIIGVPTDVHGNLRTIDFNTNQLVPQFGVTQGMYKTDHNNFAPRFGFAYSPFKLKGRQTVVRGGYGIYYNAAPLQIYTVLGNNPPASLTEAYNVASGQRLTLANGFAGSGVATPFPALLGISDDFRPAYVQSWALTVQQELWRNTVFEVGYVGSKSTGLDQTVAQNMPTPGPGNNQLRQPIQSMGAIRFFSSDSNSTYHALQSRFERRLNTGMTILAAYTFSKAIDDNFFGTSTPLNTARWAQDPYNRKAEKSRSSFDIPQRLSVTYLYQPFHGKTIAGSEFAGKVVRNWQISGTTTAQSGLGWTANISGDPANLGAYGTNIRANRVGPSRPDGFTPDPFLWVSRAAFSIPDRATDAKCIANSSSCTYFGNLGRMTEQGPGIFAWDMSIARAFPVRETQRLEFRFEMFNAFNRPHFDIPNRNVDAAIFGRITSTNPQVLNRSLQFGLKYVF